MDSSGSNMVNIFDIYRRYCDIRSRSGHENAKEELNLLLKLIESKRMMGSLSLNSIFGELHGLMSHLDLMILFNSHASMVLYFSCVGRMDKGTSKHQRHNISEDTWHQILAFSRCVHEDLEGYDSKGAWPVLIDDFVAHMYRITRSNSCSSLNILLKCGDPKVQSCISDDAFPGLDIFSGSKRKSFSYSGEMDSLDSCSNSRIGTLLQCKRGRETSWGNQQGTSEANQQRNAMGDDYMEMVKPENSLDPRTNSMCVVEGSLSKGFAGLLSTGSYKP
ncbi:uncharacterized protein LOC113275911 isoform X3 [Papaver somniferum]|uniref:uncharacterized protein LOC113275911 isoform X3 n=1 Tax=Papaver somniferum TaxID=3469 RepID=UPI000E6FCA45|nr:uncharacterized protein LOC113275911 isoform X3 [Papaver somniferum]